MAGLRPLTGDPSIDFADEEYGPFPQLGPPSPMAQGPEDMPDLPQGYQNPSPLKNPWLPLINAGAVGASMAVPGLTAGLGPIMGPLANIGGQAAIGAGEQALKGNSSLSGGLIAGGLQTGLEGLAAPLKFAKSLKVGAAKQGAYEAEGQATQQAYDEAVNSLKTAYKEANQARDLSLSNANKSQDLAYKETLRNQKQTYQADLQKQKLDYEQAVKDQDLSHAEAVKAHAEEAASTITERFKDLVPSWEGLRDGTKGLLDMVYGRGQELVSKTFDKAIKAAAELASSAKPITIKAEDAENLGVKVLAKGQGEKSGEVAVSASELLTKVQGAWRENLDTYRRVTNKLEQEGIVTGPAREEYKNAQGLIRIIDKTKALAGEIFNPQKILNAFTELQKLKEVRNRGLGNINEGPLQAVRGVPQPPTPIERPIPLQRPTLPDRPAPLELESLPMPEFPQLPQRGPLAPGVSAYDRPSPWLLGAIGAGAGGGIGHATGMGPLGYVGGHIGGLAAGHVLPKRMYMGEIPPDFLTMAGMDLPTLIQLYMREQFGQ